MPLYKAHISYYFLGVEEHWGWGVKSPTPDSHDEMQKCVDSYWWFVSDLKMSPSPRYFCLKKIFHHGILKGLQPPAMPRFFQGNRWPQ